MKFLVGTGGALVAFALAIAVVVSAPASEPRGGLPSAKALEEIPPSLLGVYMNAAATCPGLPWQVLAAVGFIESGHGGGRLDPATGAVQPPILGPALDGNGFAAIPDRFMPDGWARAMGPMQFLSTTWASAGRLAPGRPPGSRPDVHNAWDAIYSAAGYLCGGGGQLTDLDAAILRYNHSERYLNDVMAKATEYGLGTMTGANGMVCPVAGPVEFTNDWGDPRSGGRTHQGNDLFARHGTPLVAVESGEITGLTNTDTGLGGISIWLRGDSGTEYYYAHNSINAVTTGERVDGGQVVAYLGATGNAAGGSPHLHFQLHPAGGDPTNPYPVLSVVCNR